VTELSETARALQELSETDDPKRVLAAVAACVRAGDSLREITKMLRRSEWRYTVLRSGNICDVARLGELLEGYAELLDQVKRTLEFGVPNSSLEGLEARETLGQYCFELLAEAHRAERYLLDTDPVLDPEGDVKRLFDGKGLHWDGAQTVEKFPGEREKLLKAGMMETHFYDA
jgi:hypothetical protein